MTDEILIPSIVADKPKTSSEVMEKFVPLILLNVQTLSISLNLVSKEFTIGDEVIKTRFL